MNVKESLKVAAYVISNYGNEGSYEGWRKRGELPAQIRKLASTLRDVAKRKEKKK